MSVQVYIPTPFRRATNNKDRVSFDVPDVKALLDRLEEQFGGLKGLVRDERGEIHRHVNVYVNNEPIDPQTGLGTPLRDGDEVAIIPALAGGSSEAGASPWAIAGAPGAGAPGADVSRPMIFTAQELAQIKGQAEAEYPAECCGVLLLRSDPRADRLLLPCRNIQDELHRKDAATHPRDSRTAYFIDPKDLLTIGRREGDGYRVAVIYHSHIDAGAYFSATDRRNALIDGEPTYPDAVYVVVSVVSGRVADAQAFVWDSAARDFVATGAAGC